MVNSYMEYGVADAKNHLPKLIKAAMEGETVVITNRGEAVVELVRVRPKRQKGLGSRPGLTASLPPDWDSREEKERFLKDFDGLDEL